MSVTIPLCRRGLCYLDYSVDTATLMAIESELAGELRDGDSDLAYMIVEDQKAGYPMKGMRKRTWHADCLIDTTQKMRIALDRIVRQHRGEQV